MDKYIAILTPGQGEDQQTHDFTLKPGTTVLDALREIGIEHPNQYVLEDDEGNALVGGENFYAKGQDGHKYYLTPDQARVGHV